MSSTSGAMLRPGTLIATGCLALLSVWRATDGQTALALMFAFLAVGNLALSLWLARHRRDPRAVPGAPGTVAATTPQELDRQRRTRWTWLGIAVFGWVVAVAGLFFFPPMSLVLAGLSLYATLRYTRGGPVPRRVEGTSGER